MEKIKIYAKANLSLCVTGEQDGRHTLDMIAGSCRQIYDEIHLEPLQQKQVIFQCDNKLVPRDNTAVRMCEGFIQRFHTQGARITLKKGIPFEGGLGGSSAAAAGVCVLMQACYGAQKQSEIRELCKSIGSDVFYMLEGGFARLTGIGDEVKKLRVPSLFALVVKPDSGVNTKECFALFDKRKEEDSIKIDNSALERALCARDIALIRAHMRNHLQEAACQLNPQIIPLIKRTGGVMSGSGSSIVQVYECEEEAREAAKEVGGIYTELF